MLRPWESETARPWEVPQGLYPRLVAIHRLKTVAGSVSSDTIGLTGYSGAEQSTSPSDVQGETVLFINLPAQIQAASAKRKKASSLPGDVVDVPQWLIFIPSASLPQYAVRDRDLVVDDESYRYEVGQAAWSPLGTKLICIRLEA